jgi:beta-glucanase (GH16 family)
VPGTWAQTWHTYAVDRQPGRIDFLVDGETVWTQTQADAPAGAWDFDKPMYVLLNVAVGGWAGTPTPESYPASMLVDYVRAYG